MSGKAHTPGPWCINHNVGETLYSRYVDIYAEGNGLVVARLPISVAVVPCDEANAKLIAAAPELLATLKNLIIAARGGYYLVGTIIEGEKAIEKATGEKPIDYL